MTLPASGAISLLDIRNEWRGYNNTYDAAPHSISEFYRGGTWVITTQGGGTFTTLSVNFGSIPTSGTISFSQFYGTQWGE